MRQILFSDAVAVCALFIVSKKNNTVLLKYFILEVFIVLRNIYSPKIKRDFNQSSLHSIQCFFVRNSQNLTLVRSYLVCADKGKACEAYVKGTISVKNITEVTRVIVLQ